MEVSTIHIVIPLTVIPLMVIPLIDIPAMDMILSGITIIQTITVRHIIIALLLLPGTPNKSKTITITLV